MSSSRKRKSRKRKPSRSAGLSFPGLFPALFLLMASGLLLVLSAMIPVPITVRDDARPGFENFSSISHEPSGISSTMKTCVLERLNVPLMAIVIDDMGYDLNTDMAMIKLEAPVSFAFLPYAPHTSELAALASGRGGDILLHLPLEAKNKNIDPGPGTITLSMDRDAVLRQLTRDLSMVPNASGVNNHMGSAYTASREQMEWIVVALKKRGLFFLDSRTAKSTVAYDVARRAGLPATWRDVFLDHKPDEASIKRELLRAVKLAVRNGSVVVIGHPHPATFNVLYRELPSLRKNVRLVPLHRLLCRERK